MLTVLFADLVGFTSLSERLDVEDVAAIQDAYFSHARDAVLRRGGIVEKYIGDAVVGSFGVLRARDDDAEQAVRAAVEIVTAVQAVGASLGLEADALRVRVGVNTGEVLISHDEVETGEWRLTGDVVNVAARLQGMAQPGSVLIGANTALAVESAMVLEPAGLLTLKGKSSVTGAWTVIAARESRMSRTSSLVEHSPTMGRQAELTALRESWLSSGSEGAKWLITAPPGVGKSRLVHDLSAQVTSEGGQVWTTSASLADSGYQCVASLLRQSLGAAARPSLVIDAVLARLSSDDQTTSTTERSSMSGSPLSALGVEAPLEPDVVGATSAVLAAFLPALAAPSKSPLPEGTSFALVGDTVRLDGRWEMGRLEITPAGSAPTVTISGDDTAVVLFTLGRLSLDEARLQVDGDLALARQFKVHIPGP